MVETVLFVDDEEYLLNSMERLFADYEDIRMLRAINAEEALKHVKNENISLLVSDNMMPGMKGIELLTRVKDISPDTVKIMVTAYADLSTALEAINHGEVFRFIVKPVDNNIMVKSVIEGINRYRVAYSLKNKDEATLLSLAQTIELKDPYTRGHCDRVARYALMISDALKLPDEMKRLIKHGSWLHDCGKIGVPEKILNYNGNLNSEDLEIVKNHPRWGADVAKYAELSEVIISIILYHHERFDGKGYPSGLKGKDIPLETRIVTVADVYDALITDRPYRKGYSKKEGEDIIFSMKGNILDPEIVGIFLSNIK